MNIFKRIAAKFFNASSPPDTRDKIYTISGELCSFDITLPYASKLPEYQQLFKMYDRKIAKIAKLVYAHSGGTCIDIGANVGDTALAIRANTKMPLICIEGDAGYFSYLEKNILHADSISIVKSFVGKENETIKGDLIKVNGTGKIVTANSGAKEIVFSSLSEILSQHTINPSDISLLKTDTDGFDFDILLGSKNFISEIKPSLFFEYEINTPASNQQSLELIAFLSGIGYKFIAYDNFGNFFSMIGADFVQRFTDINAYLKSCALNGGGIYYADIFATIDAEILTKLYSEECPAGRSPI